MEVALTFAKFAIIAEFVLIILTIAMTYILLLIFNDKRKKREKLTEEISNYFAQLIPLEAASSDFNFPKRWERLDIIVPVLYKFTKLVQDESWEKQKLNVVRAILLPLARRAAESNNWILRFYAAESFGLVYEEVDEKYVIDLVQDPNPLIRLNAFYTAIYRGSSAAIDIIIEKMSVASGLTQAMVLPAFDDASNKTREHVELRLQEEMNPVVKATCYVILLRFPRSQITWEIEKDITSANIKLRMAAIRFITHSDKEIAGPLLLNLLHDAEWQARTVALHCINNIRYLPAIPHVELCLNDPNEWVRLFASETLANLQQPGQQIIRTRDVNEEKEVFDIALQVLDT